MWLSVGNSHLIPKASKYQLVSPIPSLKKLSSCSSLPAFSNAVCHNSVILTAISTWIASRHIYGCCNAQIDIDFMKRFIDSLLRLDLEQAAADVISAIRNDDTIATRSEIMQSLLKETDPKVLTHSCMWLEYWHADSAKAIQKRKFSHIVTNRTARTLQHSPSQAQDRGRRNP